MVEKREEATGPREVNPWPAARRPNIANPTESRMLDRPHIENTHPKIQTTPRPSRRRRLKAKIRNGVSPAALQALTAARAFIAGTFPTLDAAALAHGSHRNAVGAAVTILKVDDAALTNNVLSGQRPLMAAAKSVKNAADLIAAFWASSGAERRLFGKTITPATIFDEVVCAAL
jgi:hypothetical protein